MEWSFCYLHQSQANERAVFLRLAETLTAFLARLHSAADTLSIVERQRIVRLVVNFGNH
jgi:site-specific DNA recombinase